MHITSDNSVSVCPECWGWNNSQNVQTGDSFRNKLQCVAGVQTIWIMLTKNEVLWKLKCLSPPLRKRWYSSDIYPFPSKNNSLTNNKNCLANTRNPTYARIVDMRLISTVSWSHDFGCWGHLAVLLSRSYDWWCGQGRWTVRCLLLDDSGGLNRNTLGMWVGWRLKW